MTATKSSATDIVTEMDQASERLLVEHIRAARPDDGFLGEEGADEAGTSGVTWVIDPIDGTVNYLYQLPGFAVSVGVRIGDDDRRRRRREPDERRGVDGAARPRRLARRPADPRQRAAGAGDGAGRDRLRLRRRSGAGRAGAGAAPACCRRSATCVGSGAASLDLCALACGRVDGYYEQGLKPWDLAAGGLIATEAGAVVGGLAGRPAGESLVVAAPPGLFEQLEGAAARPSTPTATSAGSGGERLVLVLGGQALERLDLAEADLDEVVVPLEAGLLAATRRAVSMRVSISCWNSLMATALSSRVHARRQSGRGNGHRRNASAPGAWPSVTRRDRPRETICRISLRVTVVAG